jgi:iron-sulfur cluster repair protein YtfE (RIC family)
MQVPESIETEHEEIHAALVEATSAPGEVGVAARQLAEVLHPHFVREEQIALPPLGLLVPLAAGAPISASVRSEALAMTEQLRTEMPRMLEEHERIRAAVGKLRDAARAAGAEEAEELAETLALHARTEEEILYPAALLVGDLLQAPSRDPER